MSRVPFDSVAGQYAGTALVQKNASGRLRELLSAGPEDDILDLGCGPGHITALFRNVTKGRITGTDASPEMIARAREAFPDIEFRSERAGELADTDAFDRIFCNSTFQWFADDPDGVVHNCYRALRSGGRMAVQAPGSSRYCPLFMEGFENLCRDPVYGETARSFKSPWLFLDTAGDYADLFIRAGFTVPYAEIVTTRSRHTLGEAVGIFRSGAGAAYLNPDFYARPLPPEWESVFAGVLEDCFRRNADGDTVELVFNRIYLTADKP